LDVFISHFSCRFHDPAVHRLYHGSLRVCFGNVALNLKPHRSPTLQMLFYRFFAPEVILGSRFQPQHPHVDTHDFEWAQQGIFLRPAFLFRRVGPSVFHGPPSTSPPLVFHTLALSAPPYPGPPVGVLSRSCVPLPAVKKFARLQPPRAPREFL